MSHYYILERDTCSNRGSCNLYSGVCTCYQGFTNVNCDTLTPLMVPSNYESTGTISITSTNKSYTNNILILNSSSITSDTFLTISDGIHTSPSFLLNQYGDIIMNSGGLTTRKCII
jgi:hypothetical protein